MGNGRKRADVRQWLRQHKCPGSSYAIQYGQDSRIRDEGNERTWAGKNGGFGGELLAETVDADSSGCAIQARRRIAIAAEVVARTADLMIARDGRHGLANVERRNGVASIGVWRGARDVAIVVQANRPERTDVAHAVDRAHEHGFLIGNAPVFNPHRTHRASPSDTPRDARTRNAHFIWAHAIVRDRAAEHGIRAHAEHCVAGVSAAAIGVAHARGGALARNALVVCGALRLIGALVGRSRADATDACVPRASASAVRVFAAGRRVLRDAPIGGTRVSEDATDLGA